MKTAIATGGSRGIGACVVTRSRAFLVMTQLAIKQMLAQKTGGPEPVTRSFAMEYVKQGIRVNAVAPGVVDTQVGKW